MNNFSINFAATPTIGYLDVATMQLHWRNQVPDDDEVFQHLDQSIESGGFDWYFHGDIMLIPDPVPAAHRHWDQQVLVGQQTIPCVGRFILAFHYEVVGHVNVASSLTIPEFEHLQRELALG